MRMTIPSPISQETNSSTCVSQHFLLRVGGLPSDVVDDLCFVETTEWIQKVLHLESQLQAKSDRLVNALYQAVPMYGNDRTLQHTLLSLKRDIFNMRVPKNESHARSAIADLPLPERAQLEEWLDLIGSYGKLRRGGQAIFQKELESKRALLKAVLRDFGFRSGLLLASPTLEKSLDPYLEAPDHALTRRLRLTERTVLLYLLRTACKTSPFSTLTVVTHGSFENGERDREPDVTYLIQDMEKRSFARLNVAILSRLSTLLLSCCKVQTDLPVSLKPGWEIHGDRIRYLRRMLTTMSDEGPQALDIVKESIFYLPLSPTLRNLIMILEDGREVPLKELIHKLSTESDGEKAEHTIEEFLCHLLRLDLLTVSGLRPSTYSRNTLGQYRERMAALGSPTTATVASHLWKVESLVDGYPTASVSQRREILADIQQELKACYSLVDGTEQDIPRTLLYEDAIITPEHLTISSKAWDGMLVSLADIQCLLPIFDVTVGPRLVMKGFFKTIYGEGQICDDALSFAETFSQDYYDQYRRAHLTRAQTDKDGNLLPSLNHFHIPEIDRLDEARRALADYISWEFEKNSSDKQEIILSRASLQAIANRIPTNISRLYSHTFFSQLARTEEGPRLVINRAYSGLTQMFSRFIYLFEKDGANPLNQSLRKTLEEIQPPDAVFAELQGAYDANLNLHPPVAGYELVCPGEQSARPVEEQLQIQDLFIEHDKNSDALRLWSKRLQREVIPLYLGFLLPMALPQLQQILINFSCPSFSPLSFWTGVKTPHVGSSIAFYPRIRYDDIIVQRAMWKMAPEHLPQRAAAQSDADYFLSMTRWRQQNGVPRRVFVTPDSLASRGADSREEQDVGADRLMLKPMYVDFDNYFTVSLLERMVSKLSTRLVITEMLPDRDQLWLRHDGKSYVTELILELNRLPRRSQ